jgi:hypothetical protein
MNLTYIGQEIWEVQVEILVHPQVACDHHWADFHKICPCSKNFLKWSCTKCHENSADGLVTDARSQEDGWVDMFSTCSPLPFFKCVYITNITQNTYIGSWTVTEIMAREKCGLPMVPHTVPVLCDVQAMATLEPEMTQHNSQNRLQIRN